MPTGARGPDAANAVTRAGDNGALAGANTGCEIVAAWDCGLVCEHRFDGASGAAAAGEGAGTSDASAMAANLPDDEAAPSGVVEEEPAPGTVP
mmetsp:Transcript_120675/g.346736  ORF Transcript_120675/g.346736 Transcript_120675/m.346736 type:complete len:93 (-) Transcript_120675:2416-2694(-)